MLTRIGNLIFASGFLLMIIGRDWRWAGSSATTTHGPMPILGIALTTIICTWFLAALILFFRSRLAWFVSLAGLGQTVLFFAWVLMSIAGEYFFPNAQMLHDREMTGAVASVIALLMAFGFFGVWLAVSLGLFIRLLKMHSEFRWI